MGSHWIRIASRFAGVGLVYTANTGHLKGISSWHLAALHRPAWFSPPRLIEARVHQGISGRTLGPPSEAGVGWRLWVLFSGWHEEKPEPFRTFQAASFFCQPCSSIVPQTEGIERWELRDFNVKKMKPDWSCCRCDVMD